jgi:general secretion pathway protein K
MDAARTPHRRRHPRSQRGVALIIAVVGIALLTVVATEFAYNSRVDLEMAANSRDEVRAHYLARSGVGLSRLLLSFQKQVNAIPIPAGLGGALGGGAGGGNLNLQLWKMARVDCYMLRGLEPEGAGGRRDDEEPARPTGGELSLEGGEEGAGPARSFGSFEGCFLATLQDEDQKLNLNRLDAGASKEAAALRGLAALFGDKRFEFLWQRPDARGNRVQPTDAIAALRDWVDLDETGTTINPNAIGGQSPFVAGFSDENGEYQRQEPRYHAKNARFDSLDELYRVHGVDDRFMAAFRDRLTVYADPNNELDINSDDPLVLWTAVLMSLTPQSLADPRLQNPAFQQELIQTIKAARMFSFMAMPYQTFAAMLAAAGLQTDPVATQQRQQAQAQSQNAARTFTIKSVGEAGSVQKTITTVVRIGQQDGPLGRLVYWREE